MHPHNPNRPPVAPAPPPPPPPGMSPMQQQPYVIPPRPFNHGIHLILDVCTLGIWVFFHLLIWACHPRKSTIVYPDGRRERR